ncbi:glycosyltransferase [Nocardia amikacinitolerans]|uniref:glycosyltransferase n=1 Tax=Nocardia amikacinitolerans TaxID=756689 RepID=UPI0020A57A4E|nr:glycosyltransferase [Nocardia amikacinitolerans]MCP2288702.1 Glycosyl transferase family 1 [Nocardia amikacinitolerans]
MIGYYIHHHGSGHLVRARRISACLAQPVTALSSLTLSDDEIFDDVVHLPAGNPAATVRDPTASGVLHWAPRHDRGQAERMSAVAAWLAATRPDALVVDVSVEVALLARLHGVPVVCMALPGARTDPAHQLVHRVAERLIAAWPRELYDPAWLRPYADKTRYVGGITRFDGRPPLFAARDERPTVLVVGGAGGAAFTAGMVRACALRHRQYHWRTIGLGDWVDDPWPELCRADVIVTHAGQGAIADVAAAGKPAVVVPAPRPFDEQLATARTLASAGIALTVDRWPDLEDWPGLLARARELDTGRWRAWQTRGAGVRAAAAIGEVVAERLRSVS